MLQLISVSCAISPIAFLLASTLEYVAEPANLSVISSNAEALWCLWIRTLFRSFESRHTLRDP